METTRQGTEAIMANCREEMIESPHIQNAEEILSDLHRFAAANREMDRLLDRWFSIHHRGSKV
jgi:hypothetical protein